MLALTRRLNESIVFDEKITVTVTGLEAEPTALVRLMIETPNHESIRVWRDGTLQPELEYKNTLKFQILAREAVLINGIICIVLIAVRGDNARLGCEAPKDMNINRKEVL